MGRMFLVAYGGNIWDSRFSVFFFSSSRAMVRTATVSSRSFEYFSSILNMVSTMFIFLGKKNKGAGLNDHGVSHIQCIKLKVPKK